MIVNENQHGINGEASGENAVNNLTQITLLKIKEREKTKRFILIAVFILWIIAAIIPVLAPEGKGKIGLYISIVLVIISLAILGARNLLVKIGGAEIRAGDDQIDTLHQSNLNTKSFSSRSRSEPLSES